MRNLKRALSLALATVMTLGLMVVGTGAAGYDDVTSEENVEAIEVLQAVGIMSGVSDTEFDPDGNLTRNQMAVIMSQLLNLNYDYYRGTNPFTDVPSWAAPYVAACAAEGVVAGIGDGLYGGDNNVTAAQAALMLMKALGYFQYQDDFEGDWQVATIRQASYIRLFDGIDATAESALTRNQIAQLVLNALKANMVYFTGEVGITVNGVTIGHKSEYTARTSADRMYNTIAGNTSNIEGTDQYIIQLGEELYDGDLRLTYDTDVFGRPAYVWEYDAKEIGTYLDDTNMIAEYTESVSGQDLYNLITRNTVSNYDLEIVVDGIYEEDAPSTAPAEWWFSKNVINRSNEDTVGATGNGVLTQVFVDNVEKLITITSINTYLALADSDYNSNRDEVRLTVYGITGTAANGYFRETSAVDDKFVTFRVDGENFEIAEMLENDPVLVTVADGEIQTIADPDIIAETEIEAFSTSSKNSADEKQPSKVEVDGTEYKFNEAAQYDFEVLNVYTFDGSAVTNLKDTTYNLFLDPYGYVLGVEEVEASDNYVFITGIETEGSLLGSSQKVTANAIFLDGTMKAIDINAKRSTGITNGSMVNSWYTYTVSNSGVYTVRQVSVVNGASPESGALPTTANNIRVAQYHSTIADVPGGDPEVIAIDDRHITVQGASTPSTAYYSVYGTDETIYLSVGVDVLWDDTTKNAYVGYINEVNSVVTGIGNASLEALSTLDAATKANDEANSATVQIASANMSNSNYVSNGVYALYDRDGDVIAAVVVGDDAGTSTNLVYVDSGSVNREGYNNSTGLYTWTRNVIIDGQRATLTEVGDGLSEIGGMTQDTWYQVKYDADGYVISVRLYSLALKGNDDANGNRGNEYVSDYLDIAAAVAKEDTVLYYGCDNPITANSDSLELTGRTLWVDTDNDTGFRVAEDVNVALLQNNNNVSKTYFETGVSALRSMVNELNDRHSEPGTTHNYIISAILEDGVATSIVINDKSKNCDPYVDADYDDVGEGDLKLTSMGFSTGKITIALTNNSNTTLNNTLAYELTVRNEKGNLVFQGPASSIGGSYAKGQSGTIEFTYAGSTPTSSGDYTVTLKAMDAAGKVLASGSATLGTN